MRENRERNPCSLKDLCNDTKEAWNRTRELWRWTRKHAKSERDDLEQAIVKSYKSVLSRWLLQVFFLIVLIGIINAIWRTWDWLINRLLGVVFC